jgi:hypothetical protein
MSRVPIRGIYASLGNYKASHSAATTLARAKTPAQSNQAVNKVLNNTVAGNKIAKTQRDTMIQHLDTISKNVNPAAVWA